MKHPWLRVPARKLKIKIDFQPMIRYSKFSNLKKLVALYIAAQQTSKETAEINQIFNSLDINRDGYGAGSCNKVSKRPKKKSDEEKKLETEVDKIIADSRKKGVEQCKSK